MNEQTPNLQPEKNGLDDKKKSALLRYIAILFAVAFLLVLFSLITQMRNSKITISELNQSSTSALQNAELLQEENRALEEDNAELHTTLDALKQEISDLQAQLEEQTADMEAQEETRKLLAAKVQEAEEARRKTTQAYEELLTAVALANSGAAEGNVSLSKAMENLEQLKDYLDQTGLETYETLLKEGE